MSNTDPQAQQPPPLSPRLGSSSGPPPVNPGGYVLVGFFAGALSLAYLAYVNASRISQSSDLRSRTIGIGVAAVVAFMGIVAFGPIGWVDEGRTVRIIGRVVAVVGGLGLSRLHRGPALSRMLGAPDGYQSAWKAWKPLLGLSIVQGFLTAGILAARGAL